MIHTDRRHHRATFAVLVTLTVVPLGCSKGAGAFGNSFGSAGSIGSGDDGDGDGTTSGGSGLTTGPASGSGPGGDPTTGLPDSGGNDDGPPPGAGNCCEGNGTPGCDDASIASCVCAQDSFCCDNVWDDLCASMVVDMGCGDCGGGPGDGTTGGGGPTTADGGGMSSTTDGGNVSTSGTSGGNNGNFGDCCAANNSPGCEDSGVESCVCANDSYCCDTDWDSICVDEVAQFGCGDCGGGTTTTTGGTTTTGATSGGDTGALGGDGDCCSANATPGCDDAMIESCVCDDDPYCCNSEWDSICVDEVDGFGCGSCTGGTGGSTTGMGGSGGTDTGTDVGDCCAANGSAGCSIPEIEQCVCAEDGYCCSVTWDSLCVDEVTTFGCATC